MAKNNKYKIMTSIQDDAPFDNINWYTISFLTPKKLDRTKYLDVLGLKIHNGYNTGEMAEIDVKNIKTINKNHDVYVSASGKIYAWDDATKTDSIEYDDKKLNDLEKTRRENIDKVKLMQDQLKHEYRDIYANSANDKMAEQRKRMQKKLYHKGLITKKEYDMIVESDKTAKEVKEEVAELDRIKKEMDECSNIDYLDENPPTALKYGCFTLYSPKHIKGLKTLCFKVRGLFQTVDECDKQISRLRDLYPNDRISKFEIGKWCVFSENDNIPPEELLKQLNYAMKCHLENMEKEKSEFEKRRDSMINKNKEQAEITKKINRKQKKRANKKICPSAETNTSTFGNEADDQAIQKMIDYLDDPETKDKFTVDKSDLQTVEVNI